MKDRLGGFVRERMLPACLGVPIRTGVALRSVVFLTCMCAAAAFQPAAAQHLGMKFEAQANPEVDKRQLTELVHIRIVAKATIGTRWFGGSLYIKYEDAKEVNARLKLDERVDIPSSTWKYDEEGRLISDEIVYGHCLRYSYGGTSYVLPIRGSWIERIQLKMTSNEQIRLNLQLYLDANIQKNSSDESSDESDIQGLFDRKCTPSLQTGSHITIEQEREEEMMEEVELSLEYVCTNQMNDAPCRRLTTILGDNCSENGPQYLKCRGDMFRILNIYDLAITEEKEGKRTLLAILGRRNLGEAFELKSDSLTRWTAVGKAGEESPEPEFVQSIYQYHMKEIPLSVRKTNTGIEIRVPAGDRGKFVVTNLRCADKTTVKGVDGLHQVVWPKFHLKGKDDLFLTKWSLFRTESESERFDDTDGFSIDRNGVDAFRVVESFVDNKGRIRFWARADQDRFAGYKPAKVEISESDICRGNPHVVRLAPQIFTLSADIFDRVASSTRVILRDNTSIDLRNGEIEVEAPLVKEIRLSHPNSINDLVMDFSQPNKRRELFHLFARILREEDHKERCIMLRRTFPLAWKHGGDVYAPGETRIAFRDKDEPEVAHSARKVKDTDFFTINGKEGKLEVWMHGQWRTFDEELSCGFEGSGLASAYLVFDTDDFVAGGSDGRTDECANPDDLTDFEKQVFGCEEAGGSEKLSSDGAALEAMWGNCASGVRNFLSGLDKIGRMIFVHVHPDKRGQPVFSHLGDIIQNDSSAVHLFSDMGSKLRDAANRAISVYDMEDGSAEALAEGFRGIDDDKVAPFDLVVFFRDPHAEKTSVKKMSGNEKLLQQYVVSGFLRKRVCALTEGAAALDPKEVER